MGRIVATACLMALAALGCSKDCLELCEERKECADAKDTSRDCGTYCHDRERLVTDSGCQSPYEDALDCESGADVCAEQTCSIENAALDACLQPSG